MSACSGARCCLGAWTSPQFRTAHLRGLAKRCHARVPAGLMAPCSGAPLPLCSCARSCGRPSWAARPSSRPSCTPPSRACCRRSSSAASRLTASRSVPKHSAVLSVKPCLPLRQGARWVALCVGALQICFASLLNALAANWQPGNAVSLRCGKQARLRGEPNAAHARWAQAVCDKWTERLRGVRFSPGQCYHIQARALGCVRPLLSIFALDLGWSVVACPGRVMVQGPHPWPPRLAGRAVCSSPPKLHAACIIITALSYQLLARPLPHSRALFQGGEGST